MKQRILLVLSFLLLAGCTVSDQETEITVFGNPTPSVYTGEVKQKLPNGEGSAILQGDELVEGTFEEGVFLSGNVEQVPYSISFFDQSISGIYTGEVADQFPSGEGEFISDGFLFQGTWINGAPQGPGVVSAESFIINTPSESLEGRYDGELSAGPAQGKGTFIYQSDGHEITMTGTFNNNRFDGTLIRTIQYHDTEKSYPVVYQNGVQQESAASMIAYLEGMRVQSYCLNDDQWSFLSEHTSLFEGTNKEDQLLKDSVTEFDYDSFQETDSPTLILIQNAKVYSVERYKPYTGADPVTSIIVVRRIICSRKIRLFACHSF
ncbi:MAG: hypothetical protein IJ225_01270 [Solobacterium sp.]|nr:hypothetical protein [Solobacterium sp.]